MKTTKKWRVLHIQRMQTLTKHQRNNNHIRNIVYFYNIFNKYTTFDVLNRPSAANLARVAACSGKVVVWNATKIKRKLKEKHKEKHTIYKKMKCIYKFAIQNN